MSSARLHPESKKARQGKPLEKSERASIATEYRLNMNRTKIMGSTFLYTHFGSYFLEIEFYKKRGTEPNQTEEPNARPIRPTLNVGHYRYYDA
jgi:hypothetical protein